MTQLILNFKQSKTTKVTSFFANFDKNLNLFELFRENKSTQSIMKRINTLKKIHQNVTAMQNTSIKYQNKKRKMTSQLKKRNKVYLSTKNLKYRKKNKKKNKKFDSIKTESFFIKTVKESINYELNLSTDVKVFSVFHVSLLKSVDSDTFIQNIFHYEIQKDDEYEIEKILNNQNQKYFIKWKNYFIENSTWKHFNNFTNCSRKLRDYHQKKKAMWKIIRRSRWKTRFVSKSRQSTNQLFRRRHDVSFFSISRCFAVLHSS